jgi:hypothetical protein
LRYFLIDFMIKLMIYNMFFNLIVFNINLFNPNKHVLKKHKKLCLYQFISLFSSKNYVKLFIFFLHRWYNHWHDLIHPSSIQDQLPSGIPVVYRLCLATVLVCVCMDNCILGKKLRCGIGEGAKTSKNPTLILFFMKSSLLR